MEEEWRCTETGRGVRGSVFVCSKPGKYVSLKAVRIGRTAGGYQMWEVSASPGLMERIYLKRRTELKSAIPRIVKRWEEEGLI